jgi:hypothetical protein
MNFYPKCSKQEKKVEQRKAQARRKIEIYNEMKALSLLDSDEYLVVMLKPKKKKTVTPQAKPLRLFRSYRVKSKVDRAIEWAERTERLTPLLSQFKVEPLQHTFY